MNATRLLSCAALLYLGACASEPGEIVRPESALRPLPHASGGELFIHYPQLDQRIEARDPRRPGAAPRRYYPDLWEREARAMQDFAVDGERLYVLLSSWTRRDVGELLVVDQKRGVLVKRVTLAGEAESLRWAGAGRLAICHGTPPKGAPGSVSVVDTRTLVEVSKVPLAGACQALAVDSGGSGRAFVIERLRRPYGKDTLVHYRLAALDLKAGKRLAARELPAGARGVHLGPRGRLYVPFVSGGGLHATDATVGIYHPRELNLIGRLRLEMVTRTMTAFGDALVLSLLHRGDPWLAVMHAKDHETRFDVRFGRLVTGQLAVVGDVAYLPLRGEHALERVDLRSGRKLSRWTLGELPQGRDAMTLLRTAPSWRRGQSGGAR